jgi:hypothetical protein
MPSWFARIVLVLSGLPSHFWSSIRKRPAGKSKLKKGKKPPAKKQQQSRLVPLKGDSRIGKVLKIVGFLLGILGPVSWIQLTPRLSSNAASPTDLADVLGSSKFTVTNEGSLRVTDVYAACFFWHVRYGRGLPPTADIDDFIYQIIQPAEERLDKLASFTIPCTIEGSPAFVTRPPFNMPVTKADLAIVTYYRAWPLTFIRPHSLFRFVAHFDKNGAVTWEKQNYADLEHDFDVWVANHGGVFPPIQLIRRPQRQ